ncbi:hypothetical protein JTB14_006930 [Gonioctena quinquepunctata]|nr:hypothetical protein JTB14_006930 [Gonioctena quinquepunctata]
MSRHLKQTHLSYCAPVLGNPTRTTYVATALPDAKDRHNHTIHPSLLPGYPTSPTEKLNQYVNSSARRCQMPQRSWGPPRDLRVIDAAKLLKFFC